MLADFPDDHGPRQQNRGFCAPSEVACERRTNAMTAIDEQKSGALDQVEENINSKGRVNAPASVGEDYPQSDRMRDHQGNHQQLLKTGKARHGAADTNTL